MYCDECGIWHWSVYWDRLYKAYLCDYCWGDLEAEYYYFVTRGDYGYYGYSYNYPSYYL